MVGERAAVLEYIRILGIVVPFAAHFHPPHAHRRGEVGRTLPLPIAHSLALHHVGLVARAHGAHASELRQRLGTTVRCALVRVEGERADRVHSNALAPAIKVQVRVVRRHCAQRQ